MFSTAVVLPPCATDIEDEMAILLRGMTRCPICGIVIEEGDEVVLFPHVVINEADPLYALSDAACHRSCLNGDPLGAPMCEVSEQYLANAGPGKRACAVCSIEVRDPDDYLFIGYLGNPSDDPLGSFNWTHLHKSHISSWHQAREFLMLAKTTLSKGHWRGSALTEIVREIEARM
jgi:hypothetical protein